MLLIKDKLFELSIALYFFIELLKGQVDQINTMWKKKQHLLALVRVTSVLWWKGN